MTKNISKIPQKYPKNTLKIQQNKLKILRKNSLNIYQNYTKNPPPKYFKKNNQKNEINLKDAPNNAQKLHQKNYPTILPKYIKVTQYCC